MARAKTKDEAIEKLSKLPKNIIINLAELSENEKALSYFSNPIKLGVLKGFLK